MKLRAHNLLCIQGFVGKGYSPEFVANMTRRVDAALVFGDWDFHHLLAGPECGVVDHAFASHAPLEVPVSAPRMAGNAFPRGFVRFGHFRDRSVGVTMENQQPAQLPAGRHELHS